MLWRNKGWINEAFKKKKKRKEKKNVMVEEDL